MEYGVDWLGQACNQNDMASPVAHDTFRRSLFKVSAV